MYTKGIAQRTPNFASFSKAFEFCQSISSNPAYHGISAKMLFDYHPTPKIDAVAPDATAFRRDGEKLSSVVLHFSWDGTKDAELHEVEGGKKVRKVDLARKLARELGEVMCNGEMAKNPGYTNYGGLFSFFRFPLDVCSLTDVV
jgi:hypothetical protein